MISATAFLGFFVATLLFGVTSAQMWAFFKRNRQDSRIDIIKAMVLFLWILDAGHAALLTWMLYQYCVIDFGNVLAFLKPLWTVTAVIILTNIIVTIVRSIFVWRLWKLSRHTLLVPIIIGIPILYICGETFYAADFAVKSLSISTYFMMERYSWSLYAGFSASILADSMITIWQLLYLRRLRASSVLKCTEGVLHVLMVYSINTCLVTSICSILCLVTYAVLPDMLIYWPFYFVLEKLYINALLANLNARNSLHDRLAQAVHGGSGEPTTTFDTLSAFEAANDTQSPLNPSPSDGEA
ncbi:hypothetical protein OBBRIDRAFT_490258 [Obba rivulosa]|uniref:DUF6534 domain-containing protein n=1 Tax=Obba rivulosa TaxID=1052685 RepID=A0A8E2AZF8_9APHY|nr:hypothetical protein OBBRIDRAFT_490258 [Obba rivulosa]